MQKIYFNTRTAWDPWKDVQRKACQRRKVSKKGGGAFWLNGYKSYYLHVYYLSGRTIEFVW